MATQALRTTVAVMLRPRLEATTVLVRTITARITTAVRTTMEKTLLPVSYSVEARKLHIDTIQATLAQMVNRRTTTGTTGFVGQLEHAWPVMSSSIEISLPEEENSPGETGDLFPAV